MSEMIDEVNIMINTPIAPPTYANVYTRRQSYGITTKC